GTRKSKPLPEGKPTDPKDLKGNKYPADIGLPTTVPNESIGKTKPLPEGKNEDKDSERLKTLIDMELSIPYSDDELQADSEDDVFEAGKEMDEDIQEANTKEHQTHLSTETPTEDPHSEEHQSPPPNRDQPESSKAKKTDASDS
ncbi:hypothetical protein Tco_1551395, partial [Tanacetum coccineum]